MRVPNKAVRIKLADNGEGVISMPLTTQTHTGQHIFQGPYTNNDQLLALSGVYIITTLDRNAIHVILDVGESGDIHRRVSNHDRTHQWRNSAINGIYAWALYCDEQTRIKIEAALRLAYQPICGDR